jgi:pilus assembly protein Flp/PilA
MTLLNRLPGRTDEGASSVEYGLIISGIAALIVVVAFAFGAATKTLFSTTSSCISAKQSSTC